MAYIRRKTKGGTVYYQLVESVREHGKVRQRVLRHLGTLAEANAYASKHGLPALPEEGLIDPGLARQLEGKLKKLKSLRPLPKETLQSLRERLSVELAYNSNAIEGNTLTLKETKLIIVDGITVGGHPVREILEARNHKEAIDLMYSMADPGRRISENDVLKLHAVITRGTLPEGQTGFYRVFNVLISGSRYRPPDWRDAPGMMKKMVYPELNSKARGAAAVESAAKVHFWTVHAHPFADGNGRLARLLTNLRLLRAGFPPAITLVRQRLRYYKVLERAHLKGDLRPFANFIGRDVNRSLDLWLSVAGE